MTDFVTKDSGEMSQYPSGMRRDTRQGKPFLELMFPENVPYDDQMIVRLGRLYARGAERYGKRNWEKASTDEEEQHYRGSLLSHVIHVLIGTEDGEDHAAAVLWNLISLVNTRRNMELKKAIREDPKKAQSEPSVLTVIDCDGDYWHKDTYGWRCTGKNPHPGAADFGDSGCTWDFILRNFYPLTTPDGKTTFTKED